MSTDETPTSAGPQQVDKRVSKAGTNNRGRRLRIGPKSFIVASALFATVSAVIVNWASTILFEGLGSSRAFAVTAIVVIATVAAILGGLDPTRRQAYIDRPARVNYPIRNFFNSKSPKIRFAIFSAFLVFFVLVSASAYDVTNLVRTDPQATITFPRDEQMTERAINVKGNSEDFTTSHLLWFGRRELWIVLIPEDTPRFYPQSGPVPIEVNGDWTSLSMSLGSESDTGERKFELQAVRANWNAANEFRSYLRQADETGDFHGLRELPKGAHVVDEVTVIRRG